MVFYQPGTGPMALRKIAQGKEIRSLEEISDLLKSRMGVNLFSALDQIFLENESSQQQVHLLSMDRVALAYAENALTKVYGMVAIDMGNNKLSYEYPEWMNIPWQEHSLSSRKKYRKEESRVAKA